MNKRLNLLRAMVREFPTGAKNSITDIKGVRVGHLTISQDFSDESGEKMFIRTGLTAIIPCEMEKEKRLFAGFFALRGNKEITGYEVKEDFCYLNSPLVLSNSYNVGKVYNAILSYGFSLGRSEVWPPVVLGVDDSWLSDMNRYSLTENQVVQLFHDCTGDKLEEGSVGIGLSLRALGWKGGIGTSSRVLSLAGNKFSLGMLAASNHGNIPESQRKIPVKKSDSFQAPGSLILILAVDIPLVPFQIQHLTSSIVASLPSINTLNNSQDSVTCFLFSTANAMSLKNDGPLIFDYSLVADSALERIVCAGADAAREAILRSLLLADSVEGRLGREVKTIPDNEFKKILRLFGSLS